MKQTPSAAVLAAMKERAAPEGDKLKALRDAVRRQRDKEFEIKDLGERLSGCQKELFNLQHKELPDLFLAANVDRVGLQPEGNLPAYDAKLSQYVHANISAKWPEEKRAAAFKWLEDNGYSDVIKTTFEISIGMKDSKTAALVRAALKKLKVPFAEFKDVPWNSLTALVRERVNNSETLPLETLGASVGSMVKLKERKE